MAGDFQSISIAGARVVASPPYMALTGNGPAEVRDCLVVSKLHTGLDVFHTRFVVRGVATDAAGIAVAVDSVAKAQAMAEKVTSSGNIKLGFWAPMPWDESGMPALWRALGTPSGGGAAR